MSPMLSLLAEMRGRSIAMWVGSTSFSKLADFLRGYECALVRCGVEDPFHLGDFRDWIHQRYHTTAVAWDTLIAQDSHNEVDALGKFWRLLDEFLAMHTEYSLDPTATTVG